jgi:hypothetical protein
LSVFSQFFDTISLAPARCGRSPEAAGDSRFLHGLIIARLPASAAIDLIEFPASARARAEKKSQEQSK